MSATATELIRIEPAFGIWQAYDSAVKADLFSTALITSTGSLLVDPIPLNSADLDQLRDYGPVAGIVVTNDNHERAASRYSQQFSAPIFAAGNVFPEQKPERFVQVENAQRIENELEVIQIEGAVAGELALYHKEHGGTLIIGDALINFEPYGFTILPRKYCLNQPQMRRSLRQLLDRKVARMFFAHGMPILSDASTRLRQLLDAGV